MVFFFKVPPQPLWFTGEVANIRKLHELPYHLAHAGKWEELRQSVLGEVYIGIVIFENNQIYWIYSIE